MRTLARLLVSLALATSLPGAAGAQSVVGGVAGRSESRQLRPHAESSATRSGVLVGAFLDVSTPLPHLGVLAEAFYVQRGGRFDLVGGEGTRGQVQADFIGVTVAPVLRANVGPLGAYGYAGPVVESGVRTRYTGELAPAYRNPAGQVFAVTAGGGMAVRAGVWSVRVEARVVEELSAAFSGDAGDFRHRSTEMLVRVGRMTAR